MFSEILDLVKDQASKAITSAGVPADKKAAAVETTTSTLVDGLKKHLSMDNLSSLSGVLKGGSGSTNPLVSTLQNSVISSLSQKVGLSKETAGAVASSVVPALLGLLSKKSGDSNFASLLHSFTGGKSSGGGIMGAIGKLFG